MFGFGQKREAIPTIRMLPPDTTPTPTIREEMKKMYKNRMTFDKAYHKIKRKYPFIQYSDFHEEWNDMKKEEDKNDWFI